MASYRYNSIKFPLENLRGVDADAMSGLRKFIAARETELNTIKTSVVTYDNGPFCGHPIEISDHSPGLLPISVKGWVGSYDLKGKWHGTTGEPLIVGSRGELSKQSESELGKGYKALGDLFAELGEDPADRAINTTVRTPLSISQNGQDDYGFELENPKRHGVWSCDQRMIGFAFSKSGKRTKQAIYKTTCTPHTGTDAACNFMDDFGSLVGSRPLESELFITVPVVKQMAVYTIGRTSYKINVTPQSANNLKAKILAKKRFFADKCLNKVAQIQAPDTTEEIETMSLGDRFEAELAKRKAAREAMATQDVAQVVADAVAAVAISEAMQPSEAPILSTLDQFLAAQKEKMTCIRYAQTSRVMHSRVRYDEEVMKAHSWIELLIQSEGRKTTNKQENKLQDMTRLQSHRANNEEQQANEKRVKLAGTKTVYYAQNEAGSMVELSFTEYLYAQFLEAMQPSEALELVTCEAGENEAQAQSIGSTTGNTPAWSAMAEYVPCSPIKTGVGDAQKPAFSGGFEGENDQNAPTPPVAESAQTPHSAVSSAIDCTRDFAKEGEISCLQRDIKILRESLWGIGCQGARKEAREVEIKEKEDRLEFLVAPDTPPVESGATPTPRPVESVSYLSDIPLSLAVSAYSGTSFSPDRRGQSAQKEYSQSMAADYETMKAQAIKGGTLALLSEVFARYRGRQSSAYKAYLASSSRCVSSFIAGPANFPAARMNKRSEIAHKRLGEYLNGGEMALQAACRTLRPDLRAIMAGDVDAIDRLTVDISSAERTQDQMKAANKAIRTNANAGEAHQVAALMELGHSEAQALELLHPRFSRGQGFPSYRLTNNQANIRRMRERLEKITAAKARPVETVECSNGVTLEDDAPANRVRLYFPGKPSEEIRAELKSNGFRWAPSVGAWQAYRNYGTLATAKRIAGEPVTDNEPAPALIEPTPPAVESQQVAMAPSVETDVKQSHDAPIAHQINESGAWTSERCEAALNAQDRPTVQSKSGKWCAWLFINGLGLYGMGFEVIGSGLNKISSYPTASDRMKALQAMARAADAPTDTTTDGQKRTESTEITPTPPVAVSSAASTTPPAVSSGHARNIVPENGLHIVDDAFEAWTFPHKDRFGFVMYLGKSAKPWKYYGYQTEAKRDAGFERCATEARDIAASKAKTKAETKARIDAGHGLQVGDVVRSSWGYDQTNVSHYQIVNVIGKRTVEVRKLAEHDDADGSMSGRCSPVWGEFVGDVKRCMVDQFGNVNVMGRDFGRASKIEPIAMVHGVRCYAATYYSSYA